MARTLDMADDDETRNDTEEQTEFEEGQGSLPQSVRTNQDGKFRLTGLPSGPLTLFARHVERGSSSRKVLAQPGEVIRWNAKLTVGNELRGRVVRIKDGRRRETVDDFRTIGSPKLLPRILVDGHEVGVEILIAKQDQFVACEQR